MSAVAAVEEGRSRSRGSPTRTAGERARGRPGEGGGLRDAEEAQEQQGQQQRIWELVRLVHSGEISWRATFVFLMYGFFLLLLLFTIVFGGVISGASIGWVCCVLTLVGSCVRLVRILQQSGGRRGGGARRRAPLTQRALEQRMMRLNPSLDLARIRLLLTDGDFTGDDYAELLELDQSNVAPAHVGASRGEIVRLPTFEVQGDDHHVLKKSCPICLQLFEVGEKLRTIPCLHQFHDVCIDPWLEQNATCPVCKFPAIG